jgi:hypothetical protein
MEILVSAGKAFLVLVLSSFVPITCISFFRFRLQKKRREYQNVIESLGIAGSADPNVSIESEFAYKDYILPILFTTFVCILGFSFLLFGEGIVKVHHDRPNAFLTGIYNEGVERIRWESTVIGAFAFLGAFTWSAQNIIRRLITADLTPSTYYAAGLRMVYATCLALLISWPIRSALDSATILPGIAFMAGILPEQAFLYLKQKTFGRFSKPEANELDLGMIEGLNLFHKLKLGEVGVDNSQNLAEANLIDLLLRTSFSTNQIIDWILQAKLHVHLKDHMLVIRKTGIRTAADFLDTAAQEAEISEQTKIPSLTLKTIRHILERDVSIPNLDALRRRINSYSPGVSSPGKLAATGLG